MELTTKEHEAHQPWSLDELFIRLKQFGRYQRYMFVLLSLCNLALAFNNLGIVFMAGVPEHRCKVPGLENLNITQDELLNVSIPLNIDAKYEQCKVYDVNFTGWTVDDVRNNQGKMSNYTAIECSNGYVYDKSIYQSTLVTQYDLVCGRSIIRATASSVYFAGLLVGSFLFGSLSDLIGRLKTIYITTVLMIGSTVATIFAHNFVAFLSIRFFVGFSGIGFFAAIYVLLIELVGPAYRMDVGVAIMYFFTLGYILTGVLAYCFRELISFQISMVVFFVIYLSYFFLLPESPRWLYVKCRPEEAEKIIRKIAKFNKAELPEKLNVELEKTPGKYTVIDLFRKPRMRLRSINVSFNWMVNSMVYYGLSLNSSSLVGSPYLNFIIAALVEIPSQFMVQVTLRIFGRRWPLTLTMVIGGLALLLILAVPTDLPVIVTVLAMIGKFCLSASYSIIYVFSAELYPTVVRNVGVGTGSTCARIGGILAPFIAQLQEVNRIIPPVVFGALSLAAGLLALLLPETKDTKLPQTIQEGEEFGRKKPRRTVLDSIIGIDGPGILDQNGISDGISGLYYNTRL